jgi:parallel beta-helix repeat protein
VISSNRQSGIFIVDNSTNNNISGNYIGVNRTATDTLGNKLRGIDLTRGANNNRVIGNFVGGNYQGIYINESNKNILKGNMIGTNPTLDAIYLILMEY